MNAHLETDAEIELRGISKAFDGIKALEAVSLRVLRGEVHALVGENGAGKSTLMRILSGAIPFGHFDGEIAQNGEVKRFRSPGEAEGSGISIIHQELSAFPQLSVAENLFVGHWPRKNGWIDARRMKAEAAKRLARVGADFPLNVKMNELSTGDQQLVEIAKAVSRESRVLILDEPTSSLSPKESERLFSLIRELKAQGKALIYISHRMEEIYALSDRITVLRDGKSVHTAPTNELDEPRLISQMVGRDLGSLYPTRPAYSPGVETLSLDGFLAVNRSSGKTIGPVTLSARAGEILGFGGLLGAGRSELFRALIGDEAFTVGGRVRLNGKSFTPKNPRASFRSGFAYLSEDRKRESILPTRDLTENAGIQRLALGQLLAGVFPGKEARRAIDSLKQLRTRFHDVRQKITELSGGNQQKVVIARILQHAPEVLILDEPTRGVDVGAKYEIYEILYSLVEQGKTILLISSDLPELLALSDRVVIMSHGQVRGEIDKNQNPSEFTQEGVMRLAVHQ